MPFCSWIADSPKGFLLSSSSETWGKAIGSSPLLSTIILHFYKYTQTTQNVKKHLETVPPQQILKVLVECTLSSDLVINSAITVIYSVQYEIKWFPWHKQTKLKVKTWSWLKWNQWGRWGKTFYIAAGCSQVNQ